MKNHRLYALSRPVIFAHRGAAKYAPENTLASFQKALDLGAVALELDITLTKDEEIVVIHDDSVDRTTNGKGPVERLNWSEMKGLDAGSWFSAEFAGESIPTLMDVLDLVKDKALLNIEIKNAHRRNGLLVANAVKVIREAKSQANVIFSSFVPANIRLISEGLPECPRALLTQAGLIGKCEIELLRSLSPELIHPHFSSLSAYFIQQEHAHQRRVHTYTINNPEQMRTCMDWKVDGFFTDDLLMAQQVVSLNAY